MPRLEHLRGHRKGSGTCLNVTSTTKMNTTTSYTSTAVTTGEYRSGVFVANVTFNSTGTPGIYVQGSVDGTTYGDIGTIDADITTTANQTALALDNLPQYIRIRVAPCTTSANFAAVVKHCFIA